jgi:hypothetical protein
MTSSGLSGSNDNVSAGMLDNASLRGAG